MAILKKNILIPAFLYAALFAGGCVKESLDDCPPGGHNLFFYYPADTDRDVFDSYIEDVVLYVYDAGGQRVLTREFSRNELDAYQGMPKLDVALPGGTYTFVGWGNVAGRTTLTDTDRLDAGRATQSRYLAGETVSDFDPLYFGRKTVTVFSGTEKTDTLQFASSHINMEVHIAGYGDLPSVSGQGLIGLDNVSVSYDFSMALTDEKTEIFPEWNSAVEEDREVVLSRFRLLRFQDDTDIVLYIYGTDGGIRARIPLAVVLDRNNISVEGVNEVTVPIYILFRGPDLFVTVDGWDTIPVTPPF